MSGNGRAACISGGIGAQAHAFSGWGDSGKAGRNLARNTFCPGQSFKPFWTRRRSVSMRGVITSKDVLVNIPLIWREFGPLCVMRCVRALIVQRVSGEHTTFLDIALKQVPAKP